MRDPSFVRYIAGNGEERTEFATSLKNLNDIIDECIAEAFEITKVHITENPKAFTPLN